MMYVYWLSLTIILVAAVMVATHSALPHCATGVAMLGGVAVFAIAGFDQEPPHATIGLTVCLSGVFVWAALMWRKRRRYPEIERMTRQARRWS